MEEHRLTPMQQGYDEKLFNKIYKETSALRKKLAYEIDARRFGVDYQEVLSWFDVKFIYTFNKYYGTMDNNRLKGYIINSLSMFKMRILRVSYSKKAGLNNTVEISEVPIDNLYFDNDHSEELLLNIALDFLKKELSKDAFRLLEIMLTPPLYIVNKLAEEERVDLNKIPNHLFVEFLGLEEESVNYVDNLKKEIRKATRNCRELFQTKQLIIS